MQKSPNRHSSGLGTWFLKSNVSKMRYYRLCTGLTVTDEEGNEVTVENYAKYLPGEVAQSARKKEEGDTIVLRITISLNFR